MRQAVISLSVLFLCGCAYLNGRTQLEVTAQALYKAADECLHDVRDQKLQYESSPHCNSLHTLAGDFINAGGFHEDTPAKYAAIGANARATAWMARALSAGQPASIW